MHIYLASSWRNNAHNKVLDALRKEGFAVYDYRHPEGAESSGFAWSEISPDYLHWTPAQALDALNDVRALKAYYSDMAALGRADAVVVLATFGASAGLEAGYAVGRGIPVVMIQSDPPQLELMAKMCPYRVRTVDQAITILYALTAQRGTK